MCGRRQPHSCGVTAAFVKVTACQFFAVHRNASDLQLRRATLFDERPNVFALALRPGAPVDAFLRRTGVGEETGRVDDANRRPEALQDRRSPSFHLRNGKPSTAKAGTADSLSESTAGIPEMSRGEMIRRLDAASKEVRKQLTNGPLGAEERHALARMLIRLLPLVADDLQNQEDRDAATKLVAHLDRWAVEAQSSGRLDVSEAKDKLHAKRIHTDCGPDESKWS